MTCSNPIALHLQALHGVRKYCLQLLPAAKELYSGAWHFSAGIHYLNLYISC